MVAIAGLYDCLPSPARVPRVGLSRPGRGEGLLFQSVESRPKGGNLGYFALRTEPVDPGR